MTVFHVSYCDPIKVSSIYALWIILELNRFEFSKRVQAESSRTVPDRKKVIHHTCYLRDASHMGNNKASFYARYLFTDIIFEDASGEQRWRELADVSCHLDFLASICGHGLDRETYCPGLGPGSGNNNDPYPRPMRFLTGHTHDTYPQAYLAWRL